MMSGVTAEDFARATVATRGDYMVARRCGGDPAPWVVPMRNRPALRVSDAGMALHGWTPVVESQTTEHTLRDVREKAERKREGMIWHIEDLNAAMRRRNERIKRQNAELKEKEALIDGLRERCASLEDDYARLLEERPLSSLDDLAAAWEAAEVPTEEAPIREGDVVIVRHGEGFTVEQADRILSGQTHGRERILSRAPRAPWQDLADMLLEDGMVFEEDVEGIVMRLYERGVRVTGGGES